MFKKLFSRESKEYKEFKKIIDVYHKLAKQAINQKDRTILAMTELEMLNISQGLGIKLREWKKSEDFQYEIMVYVMNSYTDTQTSGLPSSRDFVRENYGFLYELLSKKDYGEQLQPINQIDETVKKELNKFSKLIKDFEKLTDVKRKVKMDPIFKVKTSLSKESYKKLIDTGYFSEEQINKFTTKLSKRKEKILSLIEENGKTVEFYKEEVNIFFNKAFLAVDDSDSYPRDLFIDTFSGFVSENNYYLTNTGKKYHNYSDLTSFVENEEREKYFLEREDTREEREHREKLIELSGFNA